MTPTQQGQSLSKNLAQKETTCFIAASLGTDTRVLRALLQERGIRSQDIADLPAVAAPLSEALRQSIAAADLVVAVISREANPNVFYEVGLARGIGKPVVVLAPQKVDLPSDLSGTIVWRADLQDRAGLGFALDQSIIASRATRGKLISPSSRPQTFPVPEAASRLLLELDRISKRMTGTQLTQAMANVLVAGGARVVSDASLGEGNEVPRPDLAVWVDELESLGANPLLIHIYPQLATKNLAMAARNMSKQLRFARLHWGLIVYWEGGPPSTLVGQVATEGVLLLSIRDFLQANQRSSFAQIFAALRNRVMHGNPG